MGLPSIGIFLTPELWFWVAVYAIVSLSLNLEAGITGIPNFGKHLAVIMGAIVGAALPGYLGVHILPEEAKQAIIEAAGKGSLPSYASSYNSMISTYITNYYASHPAVSFAMFALTIITAAVVGAIVGLLASYPAARLKEDYLAITLLAAAEATLIISYNAPALGGTQGLTVPNTLTWLDSLTSRIVGRNMAHQVSSLIVAAVVAATILWYLERLVRSPMGRLLKGVRENEAAAQALGKNTAAIKLRTLMMGSALASIAGSIFIMATLGWIATTYNRVSWTFWAWAMMILGGMGNNRGVLLGTFILASIRQLITYYKDAIRPYLPFDPVWLDQLVLGSLLVVVLMLRPEGIFAEKTTYPLPRKMLEDKAAAR
ncbi:MAG: branched-chain amino acid ABC transporter permease [Hyperthermus sp.]|nr:MAG: branched-chain amino acid ABC transporter permease [Hyperthermus sp.]